MSKHNKKRKKPQNKGNKTSKAVKKARHGRKLLNYIKRRPILTLSAALCLIAIVIGSIVKAGIARNANANAYQADLQTPEATVSDYQPPPEPVRDPVPDFVDLTLLSSTMVYAEVYNIMSYPDDYLDKTIKMNGLYAPQDYYGQSEFFHFVVIEDASACCQQGLEFKWNGDHVYPDDYPAENTTIEVVGVFGSYEDDFGCAHYYVAVDDISIRNL